MTPLWTTQRQSSQVFSRLINLHVGCSPKSHKFLRTMMNPLQSTDRPVTHFTQQQYYLLKRVRNRSFLRGLKYGSTTSCSGNLIMTVMQCRWSVAEANEVQEVNKRNEGFGWNGARAAELKRKAMAMAAAGAAAAASAAAARALHNGGEQGVGLLRLRRSCRTLPLLNDWGCSASSSPTSSPPSQAYAGARPGCCSSCDLLDKPPWLPSLPASLTSCSGNLACALRRRDESPVASTRHLCFQWSVARRELAVDRLGSIGSS